MDNFCVYCGKKTDGAICGCPDSLAASKIETNSNATPQVAYSQIQYQAPQDATTQTQIQQPQPASPHTPPQGFTYDPNSGLYYIVTPGQNEYGQPGRWNTWFYPDTGAFVQNFTF